MKIHFPTLSSQLLQSFVLFVSGVILAILPVQAELNTKFISPPFTPNASIIGTEGWEMLYGPDAPIYNDQGQALLIASPVSEATQPTVLDLKTGIKNTVYGEISTPMVQIKASFSIAFAKPYHFSGGLTFWLGGSVPAASPVQFGFDYGENGGLYCRAGEENLTILKREEIAPLSPYSFTIIINRDNSTARATITGQKDDGSPFTYESPEISISNKYDLNAIDRGLYIFNNRPNQVESYIDSARVASGP